MSHSVLLATPQRRDAHRTAERLREIGMSVELAFDGLTALTAFLFAQPDMICIDSRLLGEDGEPTFDIFARDALRSSTPVIVLKDPDELEPAWSDRRTEFVDWQWESELAEGEAGEIVEHFGLSLTALV